MAEKHRTGLSGKGHGKQDEIDTTGYMMVYGKRVKRKRSSIEASGRIEREINKSEKNIQRMRRNLEKLEFERKKRKYEFEQTMAERRRKNRAEELRSYEIRRRESRIPR